VSSRRRRRIEASEDWTDARIVRPRGAPNANTERQRPYAFTYRPRDRDFVDFDVWPMDNVVSMLFEDLAEIIETSDLPPHPGEGRIIVGNA
jgi:hypothetical protein